MTLLVEPAVALEPGRHRTETWVRPLREVLLVVVGYAAYAWVRDQVGSRTSPADVRHALHDSVQLIHVEQAIGVFRERAIQQWVLRSPWMVRTLDSFWSYGYVVVTVSVIVWLLVRHTDRFPALRTSFFLATMVALVVFALAPTVPPRLLPHSYGIIDTWARVGGIHATKPPRIEHISDPFASMPSLHVAWSVWCAGAISRVSDLLAVRVAAWTYVALTIFAVLATGNHYVADCAAGALLMAASLRWAPALCHLPAALWSRVSHPRGALAETPS